MLFYMYSDISKFFLSATAATATLCFGEAIYCSTPTWWRFLTSFHAPSKYGTVLSFIYFSLTSQELNSERDCPFMTCLEFS